MNHGNKKKMEMGGSFDEMLRAYELSLLDETRVPDEEEIPSFSERTSDDFQLGEIVWDTEKGEYGVVIGIYYGQTGDEYEVRLDSSGMQPVDILRKRGELGDSGNAMDLLSAIGRYERLLNKFPEYTDDYPPILNKPKMAKGGNVRKYANGGSVFYIPYTTEFSFKHKDDMDGIRRTSAFTKQIDSSLSFEEARTISEEWIDERWAYDDLDKDDVSEVVIDDFYLGMPEEDDEKKFRGEVGIEENDEMLPEIERSGRWGDEYALLCDELANYKMGGRIKNALKKRFGKSKRGDVEVMDVEEIQESNNPQDMMQTLNYDPQMILSALKEAKDLAPETARSLDLYMASQIRNKQKFSDFLNATPNELLGRSFAVGGEVKFVDLSDNQSPRTIWESRKSKNTNQNSFGAFAHRINKKYIGDYYLYRLSDFDEDYYSHIPLKKGEILARIETDNMVGGEMPLVKINIDNGRVYFMSDDNDRFSDEDEKNPKFDRASANVIYLSLDKAILRYLDSKHKFALGGYIKNKVYGDVFVLTSQKYVKDTLIDNYDSYTPRYSVRKTEVLSKRVANRLVQRLEESNITPSKINDTFLTQELEYKIPLTGGQEDGYVILTLSSHEIIKMLSSLDLQYMIEDYKDKYNFRYIYAKGGGVEQQYKIYSAILEGSLEEDPLDYARGMDWMSSEYEMVDSLPTYHRYVDTINGIDVYYDYGADYYFFVESNDPQIMAKGGRINDFEKILLDRDFKKYSGKYNQDVYSNNGYLKNFDVKITDNGDVAQLYSPNEYNWQTFISFLEPQKLANFLDSQDYETKQIQDFTLYAKGGNVKEDVLEVSNQLANASKMHKQQSQELKRLSKKMAKGGEVE